MFPMRVGALFDAGVGDDGAQLQPRHPLEQSLVPPGSHLREARIGTEITRTASCRLDEHQVAADHDLPLEVFPDVFGPHVV